LSEFSGLEFTGERVIPGLVDPDLLNEHVARYRFASLFADTSAHVLDAGCGSGYGTAEFSNAASVVAMDISAEAVAHARRAFSRPGICFLQGACESLPFADRSFDLVAAFEVIEHLERWHDMLIDASRVLRPSGVLLVSTPNKSWYAESRAGAGPNPYHVREFEYGEFKTALEAVFPHVHLWTQNHSESIAFVPAPPSRGVLDAPGDAAPESAHFFLAACSRSPIADTRAFAWLPASGNVLRERQRHIALLESEVAQKNAWLAESTESREKLQKSHDIVLADLHESNAWAAGLNAELDVARAAISRLESEAAERLDWVHGLEAHIRDLNAQIHDLNAQIHDLNAQIHDLKTQLDRGRAEIERQHKENRDLEQTVEERTLWAQRLDAEVQYLRQVRVELQAMERTRWIRLGRKLRLIPGKLPGKPA
jgi:SAM-dependent methyltransferase